MPKSIESLKSSNSVAFLNLILQCLYFCTAFSSCFLLCPLNPLDIEPPVIDKCRSPPPVQVSDKDYKVIWEEPQFSDNSGELLLIWG